MTDTIERGSRGGRVLRKQRRNAFSAAKQQKFLDALALSCNVARAAQHAGINRTTAYAYRQRDAAFGERWQQAIAAACDRLEWLVLEHAGAAQGLDPGDGERAVDEGAEMLPFDFQRAVTTLKHFASQRAGGFMASAGKPRRPVSREAVLAALSKAIDAIARQSGSEPGSAQP